jgi:hypothetical protein
MGIRDRAAVGFAARKGSISGEFLAQALEIHREICHLHVLVTIVRERESVAVLRIHLSRLLSSLDTSRSGDAVAVVRFVRVVFIPL